MPGSLRAGRSTRPTSPAQWERALAINLGAQVHLIRACLDQLTRNGDGRIVNIASTEGLGATASMSPYTASKHGVVGLTRALAVELGAKGVTVNCICPGPIHTGMTAVIPDEAKAEVRAAPRARAPLRRPGGSGADDAVARPARRVVRERRDRPGRRRPDRPNT